MTLPPSRRFWLKPKAVWRDPPGRFEPGCVLVEDDRIVAVEAPSTPEPGEGWSIIDLAGNTAAGLINTHVHLEFSASANPLSEYLSETIEERLMRAIGNANTLLMSGVTTARDCGSHWSMLALARRRDLSPVPLPRLSVFRPSNHGAEGPPSFHGWRRARCGRYSGAYRQAGPRGRTQHQGDGERRRHDARFAAGGNGSLPKGN